MEKLPPPTFVLKPLSRKEKDAVLDCPPRKEVFIGEHLYLALIVENPYQDETCEVSESIRQLWTSTFQQLVVSGKISSSLSSKASLSGVAPSVVSNSLPQVGKHLIQVHKNGNISYIMSVFIEPSLMHTCSVTFSVDIISQTTKKVDPFYSFEASQLNSLDCFSEASSFPFRNLNEHMRYSAFCEASVMNPLQVHFRNVVLNNKKLICFHILNRSQQSLRIHETNVRIHPPLSHSNSSLWKKEFSFTSLSETKNISLEPRCQHSFVFSVVPFLNDQHSDRSLGNNLFYFPTEICLSWSCFTFCGSQVVTFVYPVSNTVKQYSEFSISIQTTSPVPLMKSFPVIYTVKNSSDSSKELSLMMQQPKSPISFQTSSSSPEVVDPFPPASYLSPPEAHRSHEAGLICLEKKIDLGILTPNSSKTISIDYIGFQVGIFELGRARLFDHASNCYVKAKSPQSFVEIHPAS